MFGPVEKALLCLNAHLVRLWKASSGLNLTLVFTLPHHFLNYVVMGGEMRLSVIKTDGVDV